MQPSSTSWCRVQALSELLLHLPQMLPPSSWSQVSPHYAWVSSSRIERGRGKALTLPFRIRPKCCTHSFCSHPIVNLVTWPHLTVSVAGMYSRYSGWPCILLKILLLWMEKRMAAKRPLEIFAIPCLITDAQWIFAELMKLFSIKNVWIE